MEQIWNGDNLSGTAAWNGSLEQMHGTDLERKYFVWNSCMEQQSGTVALNRSGTKNCLSRTAAWNGSLDQMHRTDLERR